MRKGHLWRLVAPVSILIFEIAAASAQAGTVYVGNGGTGFGGPVGTGTLAVSDDGAGDATFTFTAGAIHPTLDTNDLVIYLSTGTPGLTNTSTLIDDSDGGREAVSGYNGSTHTEVVFPTGFQATYALSIFDGSTTLFQLPLPNTVNYLTYIPAPAQTGPGDTITLPLADIGLIQGQSFQFVGTDIATSAFRSNEAFGLTNPDISLGGNLGYTGTATFSVADTYTTTAVPQPMALKMIGAGCLLLACRRRSLVEFFTHLPSVGRA